LLRGSRFYPALFRSEGGLAGLLLLKRRKMQQKAPEGLEIGLEDVLKLSV
jgi:hypothetical protein